MSNLSKVHWLSFKCMLKYMRGTSSTCIEYGRNNDGLYGYFWIPIMVEIDEGKPTLRYVFFLEGPQ